jgi:O-antigen/teichoic acid export membrane protein
MGIIIRQSFKAAISNYIGVGLGFVSLIYILPLVYSPTELGALRLLTELGAVIGSAGLLGTSYSINRFFPYFKNPPQNNGFFFWALLLPTIGFLVILVLYLSLKSTFLGFFKADPQYIEIIFPMLIFLIIGFMGQTVFETASANHGRIAIPSFFREIWIRGFLIITALLFYASILTFTQACWMVVLTYLSAMLGNIIYLRSLTPIYLKPNFKFLQNNPSIQKDALKFTSWLFISSTATLFITKVDFLMVSASLSLSDTAVYSIGFYIAILIEIPKRTINQIATPILSDHLKNNKFKEVSELYKQISNNQFLLGSILFSFIWLNTDVLFKFMPNGVLYQQGKYVIFIIGIGKLIEMVMGASSAILHNSNHYAWNFITSIMAIASAIGLNLLLIPRYGINGAAIATMVTLFILYGAMTLIVKWRMKLLPFQGSQLKTLLTLLICLGVAQIPQSFLGNEISSFVIKNIFVMATYLTLITKFKVSNEVSMSLDKLTQRVKTK